METAEQLVAAGRPAQALLRLQEQVRERAADPKARVFLFQLLCVLGEWKRALAQLQVCGELDAGALEMVATYREALQCEALREAVFAGTTTPIVFGQPQPWVAWLVQALQADARGDAGAAAELRRQAFDEAPATPGRVDGEPFAWIADADSRLGPVLEVVLASAPRPAEPAVPRGDPSSPAKPDLLGWRYGWLPFASLARVRIEPPTDLRDMVWAPAQLQFANGGDSVALIPSRYVGSGACDDGGLQLGRRTEWLGLGADQYSGLGQRVFATDVAERGLLELRDIVLDSRAAVAAAAA